MIARLEHLQNRDVLTVLSDTGGVRNRTEVDFFDRPDDLLTGWGYTRLADWTWDRTGVTPLLSTTVMPTT